MVRNLDIKAARQTKKYDYSSQVPGALQLKDIPFFSAPDLQNCLTVPDHPMTPYLLYHFFRMAYLNYFSSLSSESLESLRDANELLKQEVPQLQAEVNSLKQEREQQNAELQKSEAKAHEAMTLATEEASKLKTAEDAIKSLTAQASSRSMRCEDWTHMMGALPPVRVFGEKPVVQISNFPENQQRRLRTPLLPLISPSDRPMLPSAYLLPAISSAGTVVASSVKTVAATTETFVASSAETARPPPGPSSPPPLRRSARSPLPPRDCWLCELIALPAAWIQFDATMTEDWRRRLRLSGSCPDVRWLLPSASAAAQSRAGGGGGSSGPDQRAQSTSSSAPCSTARLPYSYARRIRHRMQDAPSELRQRRKGRVLAPGRFPFAFSSYGFMRNYADGACR
ncbi:hypothetical protein HU200_057772 [Digitaria exilis]|uniref:Uncharacterized protein n=1 Tax=Digitaria exilis TaxID=1010633 RepID=A0A835E3W3_9POAL|nr:hypothetical protein HU200_057772 [Digitaria exilis]